MILQKNWHTTQNRKGIKKAKKWFKITYLIKKLYLTPLNCRHSTIATLSRSHSSLNTYHQKRNKSTPFLSVLLLSFLFTP